LAEVIGAFILEAAGVGSIGGIAGLGTVAGTTIGGVSIASIVGATAILGATIGLQYALTAKPDIPKPEDGSQPLKQSIPPRIMGYGQNRLSGYYMLFEAAGIASFDVMAFHSGRIGAIRDVYFNDDRIALGTDLSAGGAASIPPQDGNGKYSFSGIEIKMGTVPQTACASLFTNPSISGLWNISHQGNGIAHAALICQGVGDPSQFTKIFPRNLPLMSVVADCAPVWDPRNGGQSRSNPATWTVSTNPVIQLIDYLTRPDGGMGLDFDLVIAPNLSAWLAEAALCDALVASDTPGAQEPRYQSNGWFQFDNNPSDVIGGILSTCDGWLAESGDGALMITVGVYRDPVDPPLTEKHIIGFSLNYGQADEQIVNQLDISFTDPANKFVSVQTAPWRDEASISLTGVVRSQPLDLKWVHGHAQCRRLADRAMQRLNPAMTGSFTTTLYGLRYLGRRWVPLQYPFVSGLQQCVVEIQNAEVDLLAGRIVWSFNLIGDNIDAFNPATDAGAPPVVPPSFAATQMAFNLTANSQYLALLEDI
jgi:hypothetical protein